MHSRLAGVRALLWRTVCVAAASSAMVTVCAAQLPHRGNRIDTHAHDPLVEDARLSLGDVLDLALSAYPAGAEVDARSGEADAWQARGRSLVAGRPQFTFRYQTDRWGDEFGLTEFESGLQLPLWNWGERSAVRQLGLELDTASAAFLDALRWEVAGVLRSLLWDLALAGGDLALAEQSLEVAQRLTRSVERRQQLGDVAVADVLLARSESLAANSEVIRASAELVDARRQYSSFTGLDRRPGFDAETLSAITEIPDSHPSLRFVSAEVERLRAAESVARRSALASPTLTVGPRRERSAFGQAYEDSIGVIVTVPFGGGSHVDTQVAAAARQTAAAVAEHRRRLRQLDLDLHEAAHGIEVVDGSLDDARRRMDIMEQSYRMGEVAYANGEAGLMELLNLQRALIEARRDVMRLGIERNRLVALYNQAVGDLP